MSAPGAMVDFSTPIQELDISTRGLGCLRNAACKTVGDIQTLGPIRMKQTANCGKKTLEEIEAAIGGWRFPDLKFTSVPIIDLSEVTTTQLLEELVSRHRQFQKANSNGSR